MSRPADHNTVERNLEAREPHIVSVIGATDNADWERKAGDRQIAHMNITLTRSSLLHLGAVSLSGQ